MNRATINHFLMHRTEGESTLTSACGTVVLPDFVTAMVSAPPPDAPMCGACLIIMNRIN